MYRFVVGFYLEFFLIEILICFRQFDGLFSDVWWFSVLKSVMSFRHWRYEKLYLGEKKQTPFNKTSRQFLALGESTKCRLLTAWHISRTSQKEIYIQSAYQAIKKKIPLHCFHDTNIWAQYWGRMRFYLFWFLERMHNAVKSHPQR